MQKNGQPRPDSQRDKNNSKDLSEFERRLTVYLTGLVKQASLSSLVSATLHQINNSLTPILGYSQLLSGSDSYTADSDIYLKYIQKEAERLSEIVGNVRNFTRRQRVSRELVKINDLLRDTVDLQKYELKKENVGVSWQLAPDLPLIQVCAFELQVVLLDILTVMKDTIVRQGQAGTLTIRTALLSDGPQRIRLEIRSDHPPTPSCALDCLSRPFALNDLLERPGEPGGLVISRSFIYNEGGTIGGGPTDEGGTCIFIELPTAEME